MNEMGFVFRYFCLVNIVSFVLIIVFIITEVFNRFYIIYRLCVLLCLPVLMQNSYLKTIGSQIIFL